MFFEYAAVLSEGIWISSYLQKWFAVLVVEGEHLSILGSSIFSLSCVPTKILEVISAQICWLNAEHFEPVNIYALYFIFHLILIWFGLSIFH